MNDNSSHLTDFSMRQALDVYWQKRKILLVLALTFIILALIKLKLFPQFPARGILLLKDFRNSQIQSFVRTMAGQAPYRDLPKGYDRVNLAANYLQTYAFAQKLSTFILKNKNQANREIGLYLQRHFTGSREAFLPAHLQQAIRYIPGHGGQLTILAKSRNREWSLYLVNEALRFARQDLIERELIDFNKAEEFFTFEVENLRNRLAGMQAEQVEKIKNGDSQLTPEYSRYQSDLIDELEKEVARLRLSRSENLTQIENLRQQMKGQNNDNLKLQKFGPLNQMRRYENIYKDLGITLRTKLKYLKRIKGKSYQSLPDAHALKNLSAQYDFEYRTYENLRESLAKIGLYKTAIPNQVEVFERERLARVHQSPGVTITLIAAFFVSQILGFTGIYIGELFT